MENKIVDAVEETPTTPDEMAQNLKPIMQRFLTSYSEKDSKQSDEEWLKQRFKEELPEKSEEEIERMSKEVISEVQSFDSNLAGLNKVREAGGTSEEWLCNKLEDAAVGYSVTEFGQYLANVESTLAQNNQLLMEAVATKGGATSMNPNLDGFIAEQLHVNSFNANAALENQSYRAEVLVPEPGQAYGKNSMDILIRDGNKTLHQYQAKFGKDAQATAEMLRHGNYNNQRYLVPKGQAEALQEKFPTKSVSDHIGGTDRVSTKSQALSKEQVKKIQNRVQEKGTIVGQDWNSFTNRQLAMNIGKQAAVAGMGAAALGTGFHLAYKVFKGEEIKGSEVVQTALVTGADAGVKAATAGALKVGAEKGLIPLLTKGTPLGLITNIACVGIENAKVMYKLAKGEITGLQAADLMGRTTTSMVGGLVASGYGAGKGFAIGGVLGGPIGAIVGGIAGGAVSYMAGSAVGNMVYSGVKKVGSVAKSCASAAWSGIKSVGSGIFSGVGSVFSGIGNAVSSFGDWLFG
ncbi:hypothetical protein D081_1680 [Anaerovibrio sp. JC8]|uniref:hypothetical protein n=1 Tax=Anaerovibrio sp. JC8 TaxID=1240085 RepID=UPI000A0A66A1|nr:hypothetical protein [Anaerovibrio sp. JC8]ORT99796.1 hypothetical protein D081_1680 [Anaerovibrio sp. JC8]